MVIDDEAEFGSAVCRGLEATGEVIAQFADREAEKAAVINVKDVTWYGHAESIVAEWAWQFVRIANRKPGEAVRDSEPFTLKPW